MKTIGDCIQAILAIAALLIVGASTAIHASEEGDTEVHTKKVHKVVVRCEEGAEEDCEREIHIEKIGDGTHGIHIGDHDMVWIEGGDDGSHHYSFHSGFTGKGGFLGVQLTDLTSELRSHFGVATDEGVMVSKVVDDSAAFRAGLAAGDIITRVDGESMGSAGDLTRAIRSQEEGETVNMEIWRDGSIETIAATLDSHQPKTRLRRHVMIDCDEEDEDCGARFVGGDHHGMDFDCPDGEECDIKIECDDGNCDCTVNGDAIDCQELHSGRNQSD